MKRPSGGSIRKLTDTQQEHLDMICPPVYNEIATASRGVVKPGKRAQETIRAGR